MSTSNVISRRNLMVSAASASMAVALHSRLLRGAPADAIDAVIAGPPGGGTVKLLREEGARVRVQTQALRGNITVLSGLGGNIAVHTSPEGKLMIDAGVASAREQLQTAIAAIGAAPLRFLVDTHWHFDHTEGNDWIHRAGATIVAHENTRQRLSVPTRVAGWDYTFAPAPAGALPGVVFKQNMTLHLGNTTLTLQAYEPAHTDSDIRITFNEADVMHVGDTWWNGHYPFIDYSTGGSIDGTVKAAEANVNAATEHSLIIPGHGPVGDKKQLTEFRDMLRSIRDAVANFKRQGRTSDEVVAAKPTAPFDAKFGTFVIKPEIFTRLVYLGV
ncbi:MAG TPA: MBL fold metallo-hydrolase [Tepidisphaeraceae bacterium]|jgi:glyoxylase-like metal-dependent hydrolase (beta-lactamase superfamily II)